MLTFSDVGNTEAHETKRRTSQPDSGLATTPTRSFWPRTILWGNTNEYGDLNLFYHEVLCRARGRVLTSSLNRRFMLWQGTDLRVIKMLRIKPCDDCDGFYSIPLRDSSIIDGSDDSGVLLLAGSLSQFRTFRPSLCARTYFRKLTFIDSGNNRHQHDRHSDLQNCQL